MREATLATAIKHYTDLIKHYEKCKERYPQSASGYDKLIAIIKKTLSEIH